jgi:hypothetical protein
MHMQHANSNNMQHAHATCNMACTLLFDSHGLMARICWFGLFAQASSLMKGDEPETRRFLIVMPDRMSQHQAI